MAHPARPAEFAIETLQTERLASEGSDDNEIGSILAAGSDPPLISISSG